MILRRFKAVLRSGFFSLLLCVAYALVAAPLAPGFASPENAANVLFAALPLMVVATGQTVVLITAGIDLSVTSIIALTSIAGAQIMTDQETFGSSALAIPISIATMLLVGATIGWINGACIAWLKMPAFIVTLTSMMFVSGSAIWYTQSNSIYGLPAGFRWIGQNIFVAASVAVVVALAMQWILSKTLLGTGIHAVGTNVRAAEVSGIPVTRVLIAAYVLSGLCAAIGSVLITAQLETGSPVQWENNLLDVIGATVIGGTSLYGGRGHVAWTAGGVLLLSLIDNSLNLMNLSYFTIMMAKGVVIVAAALLDTLRRRGEAE